MMRETEKEKEYVERQVKLKILKRLAVYDRLLGVGLKARTICKCEFWSNFGHKSTTSGRHFLVEITTLSNTIAFLSINRTSLIINMVPIGR